MRLLHTSDWHLGRTTYNVPRRPDHEKVHAETLAIARDFRPDLIVHTGDLFDATAPAFDDMRLGIEMLDELAAVAPVVVLAGNHDSPKLFRVFSILRGPAAHVRFIERARAPGNGGILTFPAGDGQAIRLAPIPFVRSTSFIDEFGAPEDWSSVYADNVGRVEDVLGQGLRAGYDPSREALVFAAHLFVVGAVLARSERKVHVDDYGTRAEAIPAVTYAAFGHIHRPQALPGRPWARYAGSPIPLDFGELDEQKSVVLVEAQPPRPAHVETAALSGGRPLRRLTGTLDELERQADFAAGSLALVTVTTQTPTMGLAEAVQQRLPRTIVLDVAERCASASVAAVEVDAAEEREPSLGELFQEYVAESGAADADNERIASYFGKLLSATENDAAFVVPELSVANQPAGAAVGGAA
jgi:exonuclease SbcD